METPRKTRKNTNEEEDTRTPDRDVVMDTPDSLLKRKREEVELKSIESYEEDEVLFCLTKKREKKEDEGRWTPILDENGRRELEKENKSMRCKEVNGKMLLIIHTKGGAFHCLDAFCSHQGRSLADGDIEELASGPMVVKCPLHFRRFELSTGMQLSRDGEVQEKFAQRPYPIRLDPCTGWLQVQMAQSSQPDFFSDEYQTKIERDPSLVLTPDHSQRSTPPSTPGRSPDFMKSPAYAIRRLFQERAASNSGRRCSFTNSGTPGS
eukprot:TRINITY_DN22421_c0_g1_i1.p1 TRINITY_DN22421_c0_g1~~TRINITY_DN22421_c0_g1_i1.p1  ORF type:complete len:265 (+),score=45.25 TRINITY_DN22421_c0_g1_i1:116-910(+)